MQAVLAGAIESVGVVDVEFRTVWPDGTVRWLHGRGQALAGPDGTATRLLGVNTDVTDKRREAAEQAADAQRMAGLVEVARALGAAQTEAEILQVVTGSGATALGAQGAVLVLRSGERLRALTNAFFPDGVRSEVAELPADTPFPMIDSAVHGRSHFLADREAAVAAFPAARDIYERAGTVGSASVPLTRGGELIGSLSVAFSSPHPWREADRELLVTFAALTSQAVDRVHARDAERRAAAAANQVSESLQRSLLTRPPELPGLAIVPAYVPASDSARVGGDWYDAFETDGDMLTLVIGDVAGHDQDAAAVMAQMRNILRGVAQSVGDPPAAVLSFFDRALRSLAVDTPATVVLAQLHRPDPVTGDRMLHWSNAGHPPPLLVLADGTTELLQREPDLLLGLDPEASRGDACVGLPPGSTLVLYTDGLVERRGESLDLGLERLVAAGPALAGLSPHDVREALLARFADDPEDDIALLVVRVSPAG